jgi:hypothetical protein
MEVAMHACRELTAKSKANGIKAAPTSGPDTEAKLAAAQAVIASQAKLLGDMSRKLESLETNLDTIKAEKEVLEEEAEVPASLRFSVFAGARRSMMFPLHAGRSSAHNESDDGEAELPEGTNTEQSVNGRDCARLRQSSDSAAGPSLMPRSLDPGDEKGRASTAGTRGPSPSPARAHTKLSGNFQSTRMLASRDAQKGMRPSLMAMPVADVNMAAVAEALGSLAAMLSAESRHVRPVSDNGTLMLTLEGVSEVRLPFFKRCLVQTPDLGRGGRERVSLSPYKDVRFQRRQP